MMKFRSAIATEVPGRVLVSVGKEAASGKRMLNDCIDPGITRFGVTASTRQT